MQVVGIRVKREIILGAAKTTLLEVEEIKTRTAEKVQALVESLHANGVRYNIADALLSEAEASTEEFMDLSLPEAAAIQDHIVER